ncbi:hypothetical protein [Herbiconiux sp.]|uniref:hypothetical protein n=1 Tax=Herbiconiux sp. TaxID=1871186 RepID=UPI0025C0A549|nr:hypothetical protein [Herbiconiux sp.]
MSSTRERLERRGARPRRRRILAIVAAALVALLAAAALVALWWLPPVLAETPRERLVADTAITLMPAAVATPGTPASDSGPDSESDSDSASESDSDSESDGAVTPIPSGASTAQSVSVLASAGWVVVGIGPFLPSDRTVLLSPDSVLRVEAIAVDAAPGSDADQGMLAAALATSSAFGDGEAPDLSTASWSDETLTSGATVRYAEIPGDGTTTLVALLRPATPASAATTSSPGPAATTPADTAATTPSADLVATTSADTTSTPSADGTATTPVAYTANDAATTTTTSADSTDGTATTITSADPTDGTATTTPSATTRTGTALVVIATAPTERSAAYRPTIAQFLTAVSFGADDWSQ